MGNFIIMLIWSFSNLFTYVILQIKFAGINLLDLSPASKNIPKVNRSDTGMLLQTFLKFTIKASN